MYLGVGIGAVITALAAHSGNWTWPWLCIAGGVIILVTLVHGWVLPQWREWRSQRREEGYVKVVGGYKSSSRRVIKYADSTQDVDVYGKGAVTLSPLTVVATGTVTPPTLWKRIKQQWARK
jgi:membrane protein YdbS with pleckstrin-like domain